MRLLGDVSGLMLVAPVIEPPVPVFTAHHRLAGTELLQLGEFCFRLSGAEVDDGVDAGESSGGEFVSTVGCVKQNFSEPGVLERGENAVHIVLVIAEGAVLVFDLNGDDGATVRELERGQFPAQAVEPALGWT